MVAATALEAGYLRELAKHDAGFNSWKINAAAGTATLVDGDLPEAAGGEPQESGDGGAAAPKPRTRSRSGSARAGRSSTTTAATMGAAPRM